MDVAKDRRTGRQVRASESSYCNDYSCPVCGADVFLRRGEFRIPHFAHKSGLALPECKLYFASPDIKHPWPSVPGTSQPPPAARENQTIPALALAIELEPEDEVRGNRPRKWGLRLVVPRSDDDHGQMSVDTGEHVRKIALSSLFLGPTSFPANPDSSDFGITWFSPEVNLPYRTALAERLPGMRIDGVTVFAASPDKQKPRARVLSWGTSYYLVWHRQNAVDIPQFVFDCRLSDHGSWACALVTLPNDADRELETWLNSACGLQVLAEKRAWGIVYPVAYDVDAAGRILASPADVIFLSTRNVGDSTEELSEFECVAGAVHSSVSVTGQGHHLFEVRADGEHREKPLTLIWNKRTLPGLIRVAFENITEVPSVALQFKSLTCGEVHHEKLHTRRCREALQLVRARQLDLERIQAPSATPGHIAFRKAGEFEWQSFTLIGDAWTDADKINTILQNAALDGRLEFGPFGEFLAPAGEKKASLTRKLVLRPELRSRIIWLCTISQSSHIAASCAAEDLSDDDLLAHFSQLRVRSWLIAHRRSIEHVLREDSGKAVQR